MLGVACESGRQVCWLLTKLFVVKQDLRTTATGARSAGSAVAELRCWAPHMCVVLQLPAPSAAPIAPVCHGYGFAAVDVFAAPAAPAVRGSFHAAAAVSCMQLGCGCHGQECATAAYLLLEV